MKNTVYTIQELKEAIDKEYPSTSDNAWDDAIEIDGDADEWFRQLGYLTLEEVEKRINDLMDKANERVCHNK